MSTQSLAAIQNTVIKSDITRAVLKVVEQHVFAGEIDDVIFSMPPQLQKLWN